MPDCSTLVAVYNVVYLQYFECIFANIVTVILEITGLVFFVMLLIGGFQYITATGDPGRVAGARRTLTWAVGGLIFIALAFLILLFVQVFTGVSVTNFQVRVP